MNNYKTLKALKNKIRETRRDFEKLQDSQLYYRHTAPYLNVWTHEDGMLSEFEVWNGTLKQLNFFIERYTELYPEKDLIFSLEIAVYEFESFYYYISGGDFDDKDYYSIEFHYSNPMDKQTNEVVEEETTSYITSAGDCVLYEDTKAGRYIFTGGKYGNHSLSIEHTSKERLNAHWLGYISQ